MKLIIIAIFLNLAIVIEGQSILAREFNRASDKCFRQLNVPQSYNSSFESFQYRNEEIVHKFVHCVVTELDVWDDRNGVNVERIYREYSSRATAEVLLPFLNNCNRNNQNANSELWSYKAFLCILNSDVGTWFKEDVRRAANPNIHNGHA